MSRKERRAAERQHTKQLRKEARNQANIPVTEPATPTITEARLAANRANSELSTGPKTAEGKAKSSQNRLTHGLYSKQLVLPSENAAELDALKSDLRAEHQPATTTEAILVNEMAEHYWRIKRARLFETKILSADLDLAALNAAHRLMSSAERGFHRSLKALRDLQKNRKEMSGGFESQIDQPSETQQPTEPIGTEAASRAASHSRDTAANFRRFLADPKTTPERRAFMEQYLRDKAECDALKAETDKIMPDFARAA